MGKNQTLWCRAITLIGLVGMLEFAVGVASATTLIMPNRDALKAVNMVVWGNTTLPNTTTTYSLDCGDATAPITGPVTDQSYIARTCNYASAGVFSATLTAGTEVATAQVTVWDPAALSAFQLRAINVNMAIENGLRYFYYSQYNRAARFGTNMTSWRSATGTDNYTNSFTALALLAIQNHGHAVNAPATDIFQPVVQNGLNWLFDHAVQKDLTPCNEGGMNPCVGVPALGNNIGLAAPAGDDGYATPIFAAAIGAAAAAVPTRTVAAGLGSANANFVAGKTYAEVLQRLVNTVAWGQSDGPNYYGWIYSLNDTNRSDGSTLGWALLGLEIAQAAGATIPPEVKTRLATTLTGELNTDGTLDYQADGNPASDNSVNVAKTGTGLQALAFTGVAPSDPRVVAAVAYVTRNWNAAVDGQSFQCTGGTPTRFNKGCGYGMFNTFKGLRLQGIQTLPGIGRAAGPGPIPADDWYADYVDNLVANQNNPTSATGGEWSLAAANPMGWSCCESDTTGITALAELILATTAFVQPSTLTLAPPTGSGLVGTTHTVTATALTVGGSPAPGVTVTFTVTGGPNAGSPTCAETGSNTNTTDANGQANCTYTDTNGEGTDQIQASTGQLLSNVVTMTWGVIVIPTLSQWALLVMAGLLVFVSLRALRRRNGRMG